MSEDADTAVFRAEDICKSYNGNPVVRGANLTLRAGEVHALLGVGGAGKSTLVRILAGVEQPDTGQIWIDGHIVQMSNPRVATRFGIGVLHQEVPLVPYMDTFGNILLQYTPRKRFGPLSLIDWQQIEAQAQEILSLLDVQLDLRERINRLSTARQQVAKLVKALIAKPRILFLDEPTYALPEAVVQRLFRAIRTLAADGAAVLYVSRQLNEIPSIVDRVTIITEGKTLGTIQADQADPYAVMEMLVAETSQAMALREADRLQREFVSLVSHELRTPLATIRGYAETIMSRSWSEEIQQECLQNIAAGCERLTELVDNLLDMSSLEKGTLRIDKETVHLPALARQVISSIKRRTGDGRKIMSRFPADLPAVQADPRRIEQVLNNLLDNAIKYSRPKGIIIVSGAVDWTNGLVTVTVRDQGVGIAPEHLARVFERFYRIPNPETAGVEGSGLGLAICKGIVECHRGRIWAESVPGKGSAFSFSLPLDEPLTAQVKQDNENHHGHRGRQESGARG